jgi:hypothetical protein
MPIPSPKRNYTSQDRQILLISSLDGSGPFGLNKVKAIEEDRRP